MLKKGICYSLFPFNEVDNTWLALDTFFSVPSWFLLSITESIVVNNQGIGSSFIFRWQNLKIKVERNIILLLGLLKLWHSHMKKYIYLKLFCCILLFIYHCFQLTTGVARFQDELYSQRICYLRHHYALQERKHFSTLITCCFQHKSHFV